MGRVKQIREFPFPEADERKLKRLVARFKKTEADHKKSTDNLSKFLTTKTKTLTSIAKINDLIDALPRDYRGIRYLYEMMHHMR